MSETTPADQGLPHAGGAGAALRAAREKQGVHLGVLATTLKVPPRMLEALEADRLHELPDLTFARALAQSMCRVLHVDAAPILALLPRSGADGNGLAQVSTGLAAPFRERPGQRVPAQLPLGRPVLWATAAVLIAAVVVALWPDRGAGTRAPANPEPAAAASAAAVGDAASAAVAEATASSAVAAAGAASAVVETVFSAPPADAAASDSVGSGPLVLRASAESWIEAVDGGGQVLLSRTLQPGETLSLGGALPLRLRVGNVAGLAVSFRGQPVDLQSLSRDNTARIELK